MDAVCVTCHRPPEIDGVRHPVIHHWTDTYHLACMPPDLEADFRETHGAEIDAAKAALHKGI